MHLKDKVKNSYFIIVTTLLIISLIINIYQVVINHEYKHILREDNYSKIEQIRYRKESILATLEGCIKANSINNEELLALYKNYGEITKAEVELYEAEVENLKNKNVNYNKKEVDISNKIDLYWEIEELIYAYLQNDMKENSYTMELKGKAYTDFEVLLNMSKDLNNYFVQFYQKHCDNLDEEKRKEEMIKKEYWIDILDGIQEINNKYIDYSFVY